jgi:hypothetical protein
MSINIPTNISNSERAERAARYQAEMNAMRKEDERRWGEIQEQGALLNNEIARMEALNLKAITDKKAADDEIRALRERVAMLEEKCGKLNVFGKIKNVYKSQPWGKYAKYATAAGLGAAGAAALLGRRKGGKTNRKNRRRNKRTRRH